MQKSLMALILLSLGLSGCFKTAKDPKTDKEKVSYAIGQQIGSNIKGQKIEVDVDMLAQAIGEAMEGKDSRMKPQEMQEAMMNMHKKQTEMRQKESEQNKKTGEEFLAKNKDKEGVKVTDSGLQYKVIKSGSGKSPKESSTVKVHYVGTLLDGTEFDSSYKRNEPAEFPVNGVIKGWTEALQMMKVGDKWKLFIPSDLAYGKMGRPSIPPNSVLVFEVELIEVVK